MPDKGRRRLAETTQTLSASPSPLLVPTVAPYAGNMYLFKTFRTTMLPSEVSFCRSDVVLKNECKHYLYTHLLSRLAKPTRPVRSLFCKLKTRLHTRNTVPSRFRKGLTGNHTNYCTAPQEELPTGNRDSTSCLRDLEQLSPNTHTHTHTQQLARAQTPVGCPRSHLPSSKG